LNKKLVKERTILKVDLFKVDLLSKGGVNDLMV